MQHDQLTHTPAHSSHQNARSSQRSSAIAPTASKVVLDEEVVRRLIGKRSFATLATTSPAGFPHVAGVLYELVGDHLYVNTLRSSRKARNITADDRVALALPIRRLPVGPPSTIQFQGRARLLDYADEEVVRLLSNGHLESLTAHGELDLADGCFVRITPGTRLHTHGLGMSLRSLISDPISAGGSVPFHRI